MQLPTCWCCCFSSSRAAVSFLMSDSNDSQAASDSWKPCWTFPSSSWSRAWTKGSQHRFTVYGQLSALASSLNKGKSTQTHYVWLIVSPYIEPKDKEANIDSLCIVDCLHLHWAWTKGSQHRFTVYGWLSVHALSLKTRKSTQITITIYLINPSGKLKLSFDHTTKNISQ